MYLLNEKDREELANTKASLETIMGTGTPNGITAYDAVQSLDIILRNTVKDEPIDRVQICPGPTACPHGEVNTGAEAKPVYGKDTP